MAVGSEIHFISTHKTARLLVVLLGVGVLITGIGVYADTLQLGASSEKSSDMQDIASILGMETLLATIVFFIWFHKVYRNLAALGAIDLEFPSKWVLIYFFVPILWFYKPFKAMIEIWKSSDPSVGVTDKRIRDGLAMPRVLGIWWLFWVMSSVIGFRMLMQSFGEQTAAQVYSYTQLSFVEGILTVVAFCLTIFLVRKIDSRQEKKIRIISSNL